MQSKIEDLQNQIQLLKLEKSSKLKYGLKNYEIFGSKSISRGHFDVETQTENSENPKELLNKII